MRAEKSDEERIADMGANVDVAVAQHEVLLASVREERAASVRLLQAAWVVAKPAIKAVSSRLPSRKSYQGCGVHGLAHGQFTYLARRGLQVLPSVAVDEEGNWFVDTEASTVHQPCGCSTWQWAPIDLAGLVEAVPVSQVIDGMSEVIAEQITRGKAKRAGHLALRARRLRALADLLAAEVRE